MSCQEAHFDNIKLLIDKGCDNIKDNVGDTGLYISCYNYVSNLTDIIKDGECSIAHDLNTNILYF